MFRHVLDEETYLKILYYDDVEALFALTDANRKHLSTWLPWLDTVKTSEDSKAFVKYTLEQYARNEGCQVGIWYRNQLAGVIGHHGIDPFHHESSLGYWLGANFQGKGLMTKACRAMLDYSFQQLPVNRMEIRCAKGNVRSQAIPEKLGFKEEGTARQIERLGNRYVDHVVYSMLRGEWKSRFVEKSSTEEMSFA